MSARRSTGVILIAAGGIGIFLGLVLTGTGIGAICGIPLALVCIVLVIWGYLMKAKDQAIRDEQLTERMLQTQAVASGVNLCPRCKTPSPNMNRVCTGCGFEFIPQVDPRPTSVVGAADAALRGKQVLNQNEPVFEPEDN